MRMYHYFTTKKVERHYKTLSRRTKAIVRFMACLRATENQSSLDVKPHLYAIFDYDITTAIKLRRSKFIKWHI